MFCCDTSCCNTAGNTVSSGSFATGGVYGLIALGFVLIFKATGILNLATGAFMTLGAYICLTVLAQLGAPFWLAFLCTLGFAILLGFVLERIILRPLIGEPIISIVMVTIGLSSIFGLPVCNLRAKREHLLLWFRPARALMHHHGGEGQ